MNVDAGSCLEVRNEVQYCDKIGPKRKTFSMLRGITRRVHYSDDPLNDMLSYFMVMRDEHEERLA